MEMYAYTENRSVHAAEGAAVRYLRHRKPRRLWIAAGVGALVLGLIALFLVPWAVEQGKVKRYNLGAEYLEKGDYRQAEEVFTALGDYEDAPQAAAYARKGIRYTEAKDAMARGDYEQAAESFLALNGFKDADALSAECGRVMAYQRGEALFKAGSYAQAIDALTEAEGYGDSPALMEECRLRMTAQDIEDAMEAKDFDRALALLDGEYGMKLENRDAQIEQCCLGQKYVQAEEACNGGLYYTAYKLFRELGTYGDAADCAEKCVVSKPAGGELYHNSEYRSKGCTLTINLNNSRDICMYFKFYLVSGSKEILVSTAFVYGGSPVTVSLPAGTYIMKTATGTGSWYGEKEMFGDSGTYQRLLYNSKSDRFTLQKNGEYVLTMNAKANGNVGSKKENPSSF